MMEKFIQDVQVRWSDLDPNFHLRHSVYYDWGAFCRVEFFNSIGLTMGQMRQNKIGPILLREECAFRKEIRSSDKVTIDVKFIKAKKDFSRFTIQHDIKKNENVLAAILTVDFAWMDMEIRRLGTLPKEFQDVLNEYPRDKDFQWMD